MFEAMLCGCVPVVIADHTVYPFERFYPVESYAVVVREADVSLLPFVLKAISDQTVWEKKLILRHIWKVFTFPDEGEVEENDLFGSLGRSKKKQDAYGHVLIELGYKLIQINKLKQGMAQKNEKTTQLRKKEGEWERGAPHREDGGGGENKAAHVRAAKTTVKRTEVQTKTFFPASNFHGTGHWPTKDGTFVGKNTFPGFHPFCCVWIPCFLIFLLFFEARLPRIGGPTFCLDWNEQCSEWSRQNKCNEYYQPAVTTETTEGSSSGGEIVSSKIQISAVCPRSCHVCVKRRVQLKEIEKETINRRQTKNEKLFHSPTERKKNNGLLPYDYLDQTVVDITIAVSVVD